MKYNIALFLFLFIIVISVPTGLTFASENDDDRYDDDRDDDRYDDDRDDDRYDDDRDDDRYDDDRDDDRYDDDRDDDRYDDDRDDDRYDDDRDDDRYDDDRDDDRYDSKTSRGAEGLSEREVKAETLGFQSKIEIEIEFVSNTSDTNHLIDQIIDKFSMTREEAESELRIERSDDRRFEEKFKVEIEKRGNTSKVEVELGTFIDSTSKSDILDAIVKNSQLTREQIQEKLQLGSDNKMSSSSTSKNLITSDSSDSSETERLRQENQQLKDEIKQLNQRLDDLQQVIMEQMKVIMETLATLKPQ